MLKNHLCTRQWHTFSPTTKEAKTSQAYKVSSRTAKTKQRNPDSKRPKKFLKGLKKKKKVTNQEKQNVYLESNDLLVSRILTKKGTSVPTPKDSEALCLRMLSRITLADYKSTHLFPLCWQLKPMHSSCFLGNTSCIHTLAGPGLQWHSVAFNAELDSTVHFAEPLLFCKPPLMLFQST